MGDIVDFELERCQRHEPVMVSEKEARALGVLFYSAAVFARVKIAGWYLKGKKPTQDDLFHTMHVIQCATEYLTEQPVDIARVDALIERLREETKQAEADAKMVPMG